MEFNFFKYDRAVSVADLNAAEKSVARAYAQSYNPDRTDGLPGESFKGIFRIAMETGYKKSTVSEIRASLIAKGWIVSQRRMGHSSLTLCEIPAGFDYEAMLALQNEKVNADNEANKKRVRKQRKEAPASPQKAVEEKVVPQEPVVIPAPENQTSGQDEAVLEPVQAVAEEVFVTPEPSENDCELVGLPLTVIKQSSNPELAEVYYRDVEFWPGKEDVVRAAMARTDADYDERRFIAGFDGYDSEETLIEYILRMKKKETVNA